MQKTILIAFFWVFSGTAFACEEPSKDKSTTCTELNDYTTVCS